MYYLFMLISVAGSLALSNISTEMGSEYFAHYFVENESADLGLKDPKAADRTVVPARGEAASPGQQDANGNRVGPVTPILFAGIETEGLSVASAEPVERLTRPGQPAPAGHAIEPPAGRQIQLASLTESADLAAAEPVRAALGEPAVIPASAAGPDRVASLSQPAEQPAAEPTKPALQGGAVADVPEDAQAQAVLDLARDTPYRRADGTAFLPIATQHIFSMRWQVSRRADVPMAYEIPGHIITNPGTGTKIAATLAGVVEANQGTFPFLGMQVRAGDLLGYLRPTMNVAEQATIEARIQQLVNSVSLTEKQIERLEEVLFVRYRSNKIEALKVQMEGDRRELASLQASLDQREPLRATADGVISHVGAVVGGTVSQGEVIFEIVDPRALWVEAAAYDPSIAADIKSATALIEGGSSLALEFVGGGLVLDNQAVPLRFRVLNAPDGLSVGKPVTVIVRKDQTVAGIPVPASSIIRDGDGRSIVWERMSAETFLPRQVRAIRVAGDVMVVQSGLSDGARVVVEGATILNQVR
jgi:hypothetical protein